MKKNLFFILKLLLLFIIFYWIFKSINIKETLRVLSTIIFPYFLLAFILCNLSNILLSIKWYRLATPLQIKSNFLELLKLNYISMFYGIFVPGQASGELVKGLKLTKKEGAYEKVWIPIFIDKVTNLLITFLIGFIAILIDVNFRKHTLLLLFISLLTFFSLFITIVLFSENTAKLISFLKEILIKIFKVKTIILKDFSLSYFEDYKKQNLLMLETIFWSFLVKLPHIFGYYALALSLSLNINLVECAWLFSIVSTLSLLPISFSGLGVREGTVLVLLSQIGIQSAPALSFSMLIFTNGIMIGLIGGVIELISSFQFKRK